MYKVTGSIGKGAFASVYKVVRKDNGEAFAAKELEKRRFMKDNMAAGSKIHTELSIMKKIQHVSFFLRTVSRLDKLIQIA